MTVDTPTAWSTPPLLAWARDQVGLTIAEAAARATVSPSSLQAWEDGSLRPALAELERLAGTYDCPLGYFFLGEPPREPDAHLDFRGVAPEKVETLTYETRLRLRRFEKLMSYAGELSRLEDQPLVSSVGTASLEEPVDSVVEREPARLGLTQPIRDSWTSANDAFGWWNAALEGVGVFVIALRLSASEIRGACVWQPGDPPGILVNRADAEAAAGRTFTLLHEYAHLLLRNPGVVCDFRGSPIAADVERFANAFAAETVLPRTAFVQFLSARGVSGYSVAWSDGQIDKLREPFKVSRDTVAIMLERLGMAPSGFYRQRRLEWERRRPFGRGSGGGTKEAVRRVRDLGSNLSSLIAKASMNNRISILELAELTDMKVDRTKEFLALAVASDRR